MAGRPGSDAGRPTFHTSSPFSESNTLKTPITDTATKSRTAKLANPLAIDPRRRFVQTTEGTFFLTPEEISQFEFDFSFECPVYSVQTVGGGILSVCDDLCLWTDADAAQTFIDRNLRSVRELRKASVLEIDDEAQLLVILLSVQGDGCAEVVVNLTTPDQEDAQALFVTDMIDLVREMMAD